MADHHRGHRRFREQPPVRGGAPGPSRPIGGVIARPRCESPSAPPVAREVLVDGQDAGPAQAGRERMGVPGRSCGITAERPVADDAAVRLGGDVEHRREVDGDAVPEELVAPLLGLPLDLVDRCGGGQAAGRREVAHERVDALDPAALVVDGHERSDAVEAPVLREGARGDQPGRGATDEDATDVLVADHLGGLGGPAGSTPTMSSWAMRSRGVQAAMSGHGTPGRSGSRVLAVASPTRSPDGPSTRPAMTSSQDDRDHDRRHDGDQAPSGFGGGGARSGGHRGDGSSVVGARIDEARTGTGTSWRTGPGPGRERPAQVGGPIELQVPGAVGAAPWERAPSDGSEGGGVAARSGRVGLLRQLAAIFLELQEGTAGEAEDGQRRQEQAEAALEDVGALVVTADEQADEDQQGGEPGDAQDGQRVRDGERGESRRRRGAS